MIEIIDEIMIDINTVTDAANINTYLVFENTLHYSAKIIGGIAHYKKREQ